MMAAMPMLLTQLPAFVLLLGAAAVPAQDEVTIYRCTDSQGRHALQDFPCADDQRQQIRTVPRPQPTATPADVAPTALRPAEAPGPAPATVEIIERAPPRPMFECTTPGGERYISDRGDGNLRPAPAWGWGGPWAGPNPGISPGISGSAARRAAGIASPGMSTSPGPSLTRPAARPASRPPPRPPGHLHYPVYGYGDDWIRDECHPLPQSRVCSRLGEHRRNIRRRMFNAQPSERAVLRGEERDISARLQADCNVG